MKKVLPIIALALVGVAIATSCEKKTDSTENQIYDNSFQKHLLGKWVSRGVSFTDVDPICDASYLCPDTISFLPNLRLLDNCDCIGCGSLQNATYNMLSDTVLLLGDIQYDVKFISMDTIIIYNWRSCGSVTEIIKNVIFTKLNNHI